MKRITIFLFLILLNLTFSQSITEQQYKFAETFEKNGQLERALGIYSQLIKDEPNNEKYFEAYVRIMKFQNKFTDLLPIAIEKAQKKESIFNLNLVAELYWRIGNNKSANDFWDKLLDKYEKDMVAYKTVSETQIILRQFDKAISTLVKARKSLENNKIFSDDLTKLYIAVGDYKSGFDEVISNLDDSRNLPTAQGRIFALISTDEAVSYIKSKLIKLSSDNENNLLLLELLSWFLRTNQDFDGALNVTIKLDKLKNANGSEILNFANVSLQDGQFDVAIKAFKIVMDYGKRNPFSSSAMYGMTRALELRLNEKKEISKSEVIEIIESYKKIIVEYPRSQFSAQSHYRIAELSFKNLKNDESAVEELESLLNENPPSDLLAQAILLLGDIKFSHDEIEESIRYYNDLIKNNRIQNGKEKDLARLKIANMIFYQGKIDSAKSIYKTLTKNSTSDIANDAYNKVMLIEENGKYNKAMELFAQAEMKYDQNKTDEALNLYQQSADNAKFTELEEISLIKCAELLYISNSYEKSKECIDRLINSNPESIYMDKALIILGDNLEKLNKKDEALDFYTKILTKYPESIYLQEARHKIRILRGEKL